METAKRERPQRTPILTLARRRWAYAVLVAAGGVALIYGFASTEEIAAWLVLGAALLGVTGIAVTHPTNDGT